ncbi:epimerase [Thermogymnomonas acidicola]|uniref:Epimerase n=1 Tax=Thermogymnomonas acidicola TaxID=399579 RepID=A0AA37BQU5_9ARCH|nr:epimerase [Thermogymnomonas acidicola]
MAGGTGAIGRNLVRSLAESGHRVVILTRGTSREVGGTSVQYRQWDPYSGKVPIDALDGAYAVVNLAGAQIFAPWKAGYEEEVVRSRVLSTKAIVDAMKACKDPPDVLVNASASGYYGADGWDDQPVTEDAPAGSDFWGDLVSRWEAEAMRAADTGRRVVLLRTCPILMADAGPMAVLLPLFRRGLGGYVRPGNQWFPWIHITDEVEAIRFLMEREASKGPYNLSAPGIVRFREFTDLLASKLGGKARIPAPMFILRRRFGRAAEMLPNGKRVVPKRLNEEGFTFRFPGLSEALDDILRST